MAFRLYVGNYPSSFTKKDVENLFRDFDGIIVDKMHESNLKSYSFLKCKDIDQLMSVIKKMNRTLVSGRNLVVRASDYRLQEYVNLILQSDEASSTEKALSSSSEAPIVPVQVMRNKLRQPHRKSDSEKSDNMHNKSDANNFQMSYPKIYEDNGVSANKSTCSSRSMHNLYQNKQDASDGASAHDSLLFSKTPNKVNNQRSPRNNNESPKNYAHSSKSPLNSYQTGNDKNEYEDFETDSNYSSGSLQKSYHQANKQRSPRNNESPKNYTHSSKSPLNSYQTVNDKNEYENFETDSNYSSGSVQKSYHQANKQRDYGFPENISPNSHTYDQPKYEKYKHDQIKTSNNSYPCYSYNNTSDMDSQVSKDSEYFFQQRDLSSPTWISVTNFRLHTSAEALYELFSDYNPLAVKMICNVPRYDKTLCEAHICFPNKDIADDVILNFDNTMLEGRIILVNDVEDLTIMNELLNVSCS